jgi:hypothetical protein
MSDRETAYESGIKVRQTKEPLEVRFDDSPETLAFWDGFYGRPLRKADQ